MIEKVRRLPDWREGVWLVLGDGNRWNIPRPIYEQESDYLDRLEELLKYDAGDVLEQAGLLAGLAASLLRRNYALADEELGRLLSLSIDAVSRVWEPTSRSVWQDLMSVVSGEGERTRRRWLKLAAIRAGIHRGAVLLEDINDLARIASTETYASRTAIGPDFPPASDWVDWIFDRAMMEKNAADLEGMI